MYQICVRAHPVYRLAELVRLVQELQEFIKRAFSAIYYLPDRRVIGQNDVFKLRVFRRGYSAAFQQLRMSHAHDIQGRVCSRIRR